MDMRYLLKGASLCNRASPGRRASCARSGESTYVSGHDESNNELVIPVIIGNRPRKSLVNNERNIFLKTIRRNDKGEPVCNACGLYFKLHHVSLILVVVGGI